MSAAYSLTGPHRRPAGKFILSAKSRDGFKTRAAYLADNLASSYSHQAGGYVLSPTAARDFEILYAAGFTGAMRFSSDPPRFDHDGRRVYKVSRREALKLSAEWAAQESAA